MVHNFIRFKNIKLVASVSAILLNLAFFGYHFYTSGPNSQRYAIIVSPGANNDGHQNSNTNIIAATRLPSPKNNSYSFRSSSSSLQSPSSINGTFPSWWSSGIFMEKTGSGDGITKADKPLPVCPLTPPNLVGALVTKLIVKAFDAIAKTNAQLQSGGRSKPSYCISRHRVAIIIPYRNRLLHLKTLMNNLHPILIRQQLDYRVFVIDQALPSKFNRAMLMNIGYAEAMKRYNYQCAIFHDVDLIPEDDRNIYSCPETPRHMSVAVDKFKYVLPYPWIFGGVSALRNEHFEEINGFSNMYFGWGGEDDDMSERIEYHRMRISRYPIGIARYKMIKHGKDQGNEPNPMRIYLKKNGFRRHKRDGLSSLEYKVNVVEELPTHTRIEVSIDQAKMMKRLKSATRLFG